MSYRRLFVGGNWKSNNSLSQTKDLINNVLNKITFDTTKVDVIVAPISLQIPYVHDHIQPTIKVAAQNSSATSTGAFTGEVAPIQVKDLGIDWVILGHSERRQYYGETNDVVGGKVKLAIDGNLQVIACVGEQLADRQANQTTAVIQAQLDAIKAKLPTEQWNAIVLAYEPVWAIGTGQVATPAQAQEVHAFIRSYLQSNISQQAAITTRIIYGGSVTNANCVELIQQTDIDGFLVGGASLKPQFADIVASCNINK